MAYEYILTLEDERLLVWSRKMSTASWTFLANRTMVVLVLVSLLMELPGVNVSTPSGSP